MPMPYDKLTWVILTILGAMALILLDIQSKNVETEARFDSHESQSIRNFNNIENDQRNLNHELLEHIKNK